MEWVRSEEPIAGWELLLGPRKAPLVRRGRTPGLCFPVRAINFVDRKQFLELVESHSEIGLHAAQRLSRGYQSAYRDIHHLVLTRSSAGKLARLLLSQSVREGEDSEASCKPTPMTHEEMAMRIGASRETVTRLLSTLRRKRLIRLAGPMLVIKDRTALEALAV
jgi:CRP/FNR family cyclic AMP-dependent transcriptional regulator